MRPLRPRGRRTGPPRRAMTFWIGPVIRRSDDGLQPVAIQNHGLDRIVRRVHERPRDTAARGQRFHAHGSMRRDVQAEGQRARMTVEPVQTRRQRARPDIGSQRSRPVRKPVDAKRRGSPVQEKRVGPPARCRSASSRFRDRLSIQDRAEPSPSPASPVRTRTAACRDPSRGPAGPYRCRRPPPRMRPERARSRHRAPRWRRPALCGC